MIESIGEFLILGIALGGIYALFSIGLTLIFGVLDIINVAHGEFFATGGYLVFAGIVLLGLPPPLAVVGAAIGCFCLGLAIYPVLLAPLKRRLGGRPQGPMFLVLTFGLSIFMQSILLAIAGGDYLRVPPFLGGVLDLGFTAVSYHRVLILGVATVALGALFLFLKYHRQGMAIRAVALNPPAAESVGINLSVVFTLTLALGAGLAGLAGTLMAPLINVYPAMGFLLTLKAFAITILGGLGNLLGALVASFILAIVESVSVMVMPSEWQNVISFGVMIVVLLLRPQGILGQRDLG